MKLASRFAQLFRSGIPVEQILNDLEELLIAADVGPRLSSELVAHLRALPKEKKTIEGFKAALKQELLSCVKVAPCEFPQIGASPFVILVLGVNGVGKTTSIAKLAHRLQRQGRRVMVIAGDTFRAAAIDQLKVWGERIGVPVIAQTPEADPGAVLYDGLVAARARGAEIVLVDTAGRLHTKKPLVDELAKLERVVAKFDPAVPKQAYLVLDATTGQNGLVQAKVFSRAVHINAAILTKWDGSAKGGMLFAIGRELGLPVAFVGTGESVESLEPFDAVRFVDELFVET